MKFEYILLIYFIGFILSLWRAISFICPLIANDVKFKKDYNNNDTPSIVKTILITGIITLIISLLSWIGFIGGVYNYFTEEEDEIFFIT